MQVNVLYSSSFFFNIKVNSYYKDPVYFLLFLFSYFVSFFFSLLLILLPVFIYCVRTQTVLRNSAHLNSFVYPYPYETPLDAYSSYVSEMLWSV